MMLLRRIRHALLAAVAAFLAVILFGPTGPEQTVWQVASTTENAAGSKVITAGVHREPICASNPISDQLAGRFRWRLLMTQHYADVDLTRQFNNSLESIAAEIKPQESDIRVVSHVSKPENSATVIEEPSPLAGHEFWTRQHQRAAGAFEQLRSIDRTVAVASPITTLPGQPTTTTIMLAILASTLASIGMLLIDKVAIHRANLVPDSNSQLLAIPASWFAIRHTPARRSVVVTRAACTIFIALVLMGVLVNVALNQSSIDRLIHSPLSEVANLV